MLVKRDHVKGGHVFHYIMFSVLFIVVHTIHHPPKLIFLQSLDDNQRGSMGHLLPQDNS